MANPTWDDTEEVEQSDVPKFEDTEEITQAAPSKLEQIGEMAKGILEPTLETAQDAATGATEGMFMGAADEIGGGLAALLEKGASYIPGTAANNTKNVDEQLQAQGFEVPQESMIDKFRGYQQGSEAAFNEAGDRSPIANIAGNIGGSIASGTALGGALGLGGQAAKGKSAYDVYKSEGAMKAGVDLLTKGAKTYAKAAPAMAVEGALNSEGALLGGTDEQQGQVGKDVLSNLAFGVPAILGLEGATELVAPAAKAGVKAVSKYADDVVESSPFLRKMGKAMDYGEQGINPISEKNLTSFDLGKEGLIRQETSKAQSIVDDIKKADKKLGENIGRVFDEADKSGIKMTLDNELQGALEAMDFSYQNLADMAENPRGRQVFQQISQLSKSDVTPTEAKALLNDVNSFIGKFAADKNPSDVVKYKTLPMLEKFASQLSNRLKSEVPGYQQAAERFTQFRQLVPETLIAGDLPQDAAGVWMGNLKNSDKNLLEASRKLIRGGSGEGTAYKSTKEAFENTITGMKQFEANDLARGNEQLMAKTGDQYKGFIQDASDDVMLRNDMMTVKNPIPTSGNLLGQAAQLGRGGIHMGAYAAGKVKKPIADISRRAYNMPAEKLNTIADDLVNKHGMTTLGNALKEGIANGDAAKKNAALFSIMQNPTARILFEQDDEEQGE